MRSSRQISDTAAALFSPVFMLSFSGTPYPSKGVAAVPIYHTVAREPGTELRPTKDGTIGGVASTSLPGSAITIYQLPDSINLVPTKASRIIHEKSCVGRDKC